MFLFRSWKELYAKRKEFSPEEKGKRKVTMINPFVLKWREIYQVYPFPLNRIQECFVFFPRGRGIGRGEGSKSTILPPYVIKRCVCGCGRGWGRGTGMGRGEGMGFNSRVHLHNILANTDIQILLKHIYVS